MYLRYTDSHGHDITVDTLVGTEIAVDISLENRDETVAVAIVHDLDQEEFRVMIEGDCEWSILDTEPEGQVDDGVIRSPKTGRG